MSTEPGASPFPHLSPVFQLCTLGLLHGRAAADPIGITLETATGKVRLAMTREELGRFAAQILWRLSPDCADEEKRMEAEHQSWLQSEMSSAKEGQA